MKRLAFYLSLALVVLALASCKGEGCLGADALDDLPQDQARKDPGAADRYLRG